MDVKEIDSSVFSAIGFPEAKRKIGALSSLPFASLANNVDKGEVYNLILVAVFLWSAFKILIWLGWMLQ